MSHSDEPGRKVVCPYCMNDAELVDGSEIYPHRPDLFEQNFWRCDPCGAYVGCHKPNPKMGYDGTQPLGRLADAKLRAAKSAAHRAFDPIWKDGHMRRKEAYAWLAGKLGIQVSECHIGEFDVETCLKVSEVSGAFLLGRYSRKK